MPLKSIRSRVYSYSVGKQFDVSSRNASDISLLFDITKVFCNLINDWFIFQFLFSVKRRQLLGGRR